MYILHGKLSGTFVGDIKPGTGSYVCTMLSITLAKTLFSVQIVVLAKVVQRSTSRNEL